MLTNVGPYCLEQFQAHNFMPWKHHMITILEDMKLDKFIQPDAMKPMKEWEAGDKKTHAQLYLVISNMQILFLAGAKMAKAMWEQICNMKESRGQSGIMST
ncbi:hypothetical protein AMATHDRAFT_167230 [Amanita thiersii Skay4041]|uniref:Retrotransposon Copia-like N-terminal domain-containing protein n=1 Tax=Amanita thiersii Skay4041 TaxID=703135 RepID=A0A2A9NAK6_9AGAR|nr:hypothetical protein AMATHDRAFT_167230 [Amanita thiersii Skay4041]